MAEKITAAPWEVPYPTSNGEVKLGATNMQEIAERATAIFKERYLTLAEHGSSFTAKSGELVKATAAITVTLPAAAVNAIVGVLANGHEVTVGAGAALIYGDFITGSTPIKLVGYQHVILVSDGTNWFIIAGEPKNEAKWSARTARTAETEYEASATRPATVILECTQGSNDEAYIQAKVGGVELPTVTSGGANTGINHAVITFPVPAGVKWKAAIPAGSTLHESCLIE